LISREGYEQWKESGALSLRDRAREKALRIIENHKPKPIDAQKASMLDALVEAYGKDS